MASECMYKTYPITWPSMKDGLTREQRNEIYIRRMNKMLSYEGGEHVKNLVNTQILMLAHAINILDKNPTMGELSDMWFDGYKDKEDSIEKYAVKMVFVSSVFRSNEDSISSYKLHIEDNVKYLNIINSEAT